MGPGVALTTTASSLFTMTPGILNYVTAGAASAERGREEEGERGRRTVDKWSLNFQLGLYLK